MGFKNYKKCSELHINYWKKVISYLHRIFETTYILKYFYEYLYSIFEEIKKMDN